MPATFINTLVYAQKCPPPVRQKHLMLELCSAGFLHQEVRREYMVDIAAEPEEIGRTAAANGITLYYSVPDTLYDGGAVDQRKIGGYFDEARLMGSRTVKLAVGDYRGLREEDTVFLREITSSGIRLLVENDQTQANGTVKKIHGFLEDMAGADIPIRFTFDVGNWVWAGEDPKVNAELLEPYVAYVHFKDVTREGDILRPVPLGEGALDWQYFKTLFAGIDFGIEYPCGQDPIPVLQIEHAKLDR